MNLAAERAWCGLGEREAMGLCNEDMMMPPEIRYATIQARCERAGYVA